MTDFKQHNPFRVPKGYFDELEEKLCSSDDSISKLNPFSTPENYFEQLDEVIEQRLSINKRIPQKSNLSSLIPKFIAVAAAIVLIVTLFQRTSTQEIEKEQAFNDFIESYYSQTLDSYDMLSMMEDIEIESTFSSPSKH